MSQDVRWDVDWENWFGAIVEPSSKLRDDANYEIKEARKSINEIEYLIDDEDDSRLRNEKDAKKIAEQIEIALIKSSDVIEDYEEAYECATREIHELKQVIDFALKFGGGIAVTDSEIVKWCQENMKGEWDWIGYDFPLDLRNRHLMPRRKWIVLLTDDNDKLLFKMRWTEGS